MVLAGKSSGFAEVAGVLPRGHEALSSPRTRVAAHAAKPASNWSRSIDATTTEPFTKAPSPVKRRESPILKRAASEFMKNFRRKPFGDASNKQPAPPAGLFELEGEAADAEGEAKGKRKRDTASKGEFARSFG